MNVPHPGESTEAAPDIVDWRPGRAAAVLWTLISVPMLLASLLLYLRLATLSLPSSGGAVFGPLDLLLFLLLTVALIAVLLGIHEGLHGLVMNAFGARPRFGALMVAGVVPARYTTAPGHQFTRTQYLTVGLTPAVVISIAGALACLTPAGLYLVVPLAVHLAGCIGDFATTLRLLREPAGTRFEDLGDGIRFHRVGTGSSG
jgi:hypothetical protein